MLGALDEDDFQSFKESWPASWAVIAVQPCPRAQSQVCFAARLNSWPHDIVALQIMYNSAIHGR